MWVYLVWKHSYINTNKPYKKNSLHAYSPHAYEYWIQQFRTYISSQQTKEEATPEIVTTKEANTNLEPTTANQIPIFSHAFLSDNSYKWQQTTNTHLKQRYEIMKLHPAKKKFQQTTFQTR